MRRVSGPGSPVVKPLSPVSPDASVGKGVHPGSNRWLALMAWWSFLIALFSGVILAFVYRPWGDVYATVSQLTGWRPFGGFFRNTHYLSGQLFLLFTIAHTAEHVWRRSFQQIRAMDWTRLVCLFFLAFPLIFTGFILKGDKEGIMAGRIMAALVAEIPRIGSALGAVLIRPGEDFFLLPYLHHTVILPLTVVFLFITHQRRLFPGKQWGLVLAAAIATGAVFYPLPADIPPRADGGIVTGPWFFHGIQFLLQFGPAFWVGIIWPLLPLVLLILLPRVPKRWIPSAVWLTAVLWLTHAVCLVIGWISLSTAMGGGG